MNDDLKRRIYPLIFIGLLLVGTAAFAVGYSARTVYKDVVVAAKKWQKDATLTNVATQRVNAGGMASEWSYVFYSPKAKAGYTINVKKRKSLSNTLFVRT
jgi:hypothetical protein